MHLGKMKAILAILGTTMFWGLSFASTKVLLASLPPAQIAFLRLVFAVVVLGVVFFIQKKKFAARLDLLRVAAGGFLGIFLFFIFQNSGLLYTTAGTGSLITATIPVLNVIAGVVLFSERFPFRCWLGVLLSFVGVYLIIVSGNDALTLSNLRGNILVFMAACSWVAYTRINVPLMEKYDSLSLNFQHSLVGMLLLGLFALPQGLELSALFNNTVLLNLAFLGVLCSAAAYFFYLYALKNLGSTTVISFLNLVPVFGILGGAVIGEALMAGQLLGGAVVITGVSLVTLSDRKEHTATSAETLVE